MSRLILTAGLCLMIISLVSSSMLVCNFDRSAETRAAQGQFTISDIDPELCTHVIYTSADISPTNELVPFNTSDLIDYLFLNGLKTRNPQLKTLLSVGGVTFNIQKFSMMASTPTSRSSFIQSAILLLRTFGFDGMNVDWRFPGSTGSQPDDKQKFTMLCEELLSAFEAEGIQNNRQRLIVSASVSAEIAVINASYEVAAIATFLDFINVLTFDFRGPWENVTGHHSPLYRGSQDTGNYMYLNTDFAMRFWRDQGAPAQKLNMGLAAYGRAFTLASSATGVGAPADGPAEEGCYTGQNGFWAFYETCLYIEGGDLEWIADQEVPFDVTEGQWVGFDNQTSLAIKASYIKANNFGGAFVWSLDLDDFSGQFCNQSINPFISFLRSQLISDFNTTTMSSNLITTVSSTTTPSSGPTDTNTTTTITTPTTTTTTPTPPTTTTTPTTSTPTTITTPITTTSPTITTPTTTTPTTTTAPTTTPTTTTTTPTTTTTTPTTTTTTPTTTTTTPTTTTTTPTTTTPTTTTPTTTTTTPTTTTTTPTTTTTTPTTTTPTTTTTTPTTTTTTPTTTTTNPTTTTPTTITTTSTTTTTPLTTTTPTTTTTTPTTTTTTPTTTTTTPTTTTPTTTTTTPTTTTTTPTTTTTTPTTTTPTTTTTTPTTTTPTTTTTTPTTTTPTTTTTTPTTTTPTTTTTTPTTTTPTTTTTTPTTTTTTPTTTTSTTTTTTPTTTTPTTTTTTPTTTTAPTTTTPTTDTTPTTTIPTTTTISVTYDPNFCSTKSGTYYANPDNPHQFYQCDNGRTFLMNCPANTSFGTGCLCCS